MRPLHEVLEDMAALGEERGLVALYLHGSRIEGTARGDSDVDVAVLGPDSWDEDMTERELARITSRIATLLQLRDGQVDVKDLRSALPHYRTRVFLTGQPVLVRDATTLARWHGRSLSEDWDNEYFLAPIREAMRTRIRSGRFAA